MNRRKKSRGQAIVEMALVFPFFLLVIIGGLIDFGFAFYNFITLQQLANDTAQWAADKEVVITDTTAVDAHLTTIRPTWWTGAFTLHPITSTDLTTGGKTINILLTYESPTYTPFYQTMFSATTGNSSIRLSAMAAYKVPEFIKTRN